MKSKAVFIKSGKIVGKVTRDVFHKSLDSRKHFLRKPPSIAFDKESLKNAIQYGAKRVLVFDTHKKETYTATIDQIYKNGMDVNRGFGKQIALPLSYWEIESANSIQLELLNVA